jgi:hypothetical protein
MIAIKIVDSGPMVPVCAVSEAPIRSIAIITMRTGAKVHTVAFKGDAYHARHARRKARETQRPEAHYFLAAIGQIVCEVAQPQALAATA